ncbi:MAG TPA: L-histidine N(alpha)-methyltransferase [Steroidobacteraceae bacterium]|nr:L-histidine N(alpha)-methyltransferase [Steroidobacteraceae bacterium]
MRSTVDPLAQDGPNVVFNLSGSPKKISPIYVYDKRGTDLFERQCATPEYYLRRVESQLLSWYAGDIVELCGFLPIVELGAGTSEKTRILLAEYAERGTRCDYFPIDVDTETLWNSAQELVSAFPFLFVYCLGTTYHKGLRALPPYPGARLFMFLGSSLGNMEWQEIGDLLSELFDSGRRGDYFLLGADLDKDPAIIDRAYNDSAGYGPRSTLNMLEHLNRRYGGNFVTDNFRYRSKYDSRMRRNEVRIESLVDQTVTLTALGITVSFGAAELIDAEVMWKFDPEELGSVLDRAGFSMVHRWIEPIYRYGLFLLRHK